MARFRKVLSALFADPLERNADGELIYRTLYVPRLVRTRAVVVDPHKVFFIRFMETLLWVLFFVLMAGVSESAPREFWPFFKVIVVWFAIRIVYSILVAAWLPPAKNVLIGKDYQRKLAAEGSGWAYLALGFFGFAGVVGSIGMLIQKHPTWGMGIFLLIGSIWMIVFGVKQALLKAKIEDERSAQLLSPGEKR